VEQRFSMTHPLLLHLFLQARNTLTGHVCGGARVTSPGAVWYDEFTYASQWKQHSTLWQRNQVGKVFTLHKMYSSRPWILPCLIIANSDAQNAFMIYISFHWYMKCVRPSKLTGALHTHIYHRHCVNIGYKIAINISRVWTCIENTGKNNNVL
jgi:hypothetical protein